MITNLEAKKRDTKANPDVIREGGFVPAVYYGKKEKPTPISVDRSEFIRAWKEAGESTIVSLSIEDNKINTLISDVQVDPVSEAPIHADFYVFEKGQRIEVSVPLEFSGEAPAVKELGGVLVKVLHELKVEAEPSNLPGQLEVDIYTLNDFDSQIVAKNISLPEGVDLVEDPDEVVASVYEPQEEPEEPEEEMDISDIEVEGEKKEEGEEGDADGETEGDGGGADEGGDKPEGSNE